MARVWAGKYNVPAATFNMRGVGKSSGSSTLCGHSEARSATRTVISDQRSPERTNAPTAARAAFLSVMRLRDSQAEAARRLICDPLSLALRWMMWLPPRRGSGVWVTAGSS